MHLTLVSAEMSALSYTLCALIILMSFTVHALPLPQSSQVAYVAAELAANLFEGDIVLSAAQRQQLLSASNATQQMSARNGLADARYRWPNKAVYYRISQEFTAAQVAQIKSAIKHVESKSCLRFYRASVGSTAFVHIRAHANSCNSGVGYVGGQQTIHLAAGCFKLGTIAHELLHALGFWHQQSAANRDRYVRIHSENITPGKEHNFRKHADSTSFGVAYDYDSVMHYSAYAFTKNGLPTIVGVDGRTTMGQRTGLTAEDALKLRKMYAC